VSWYTQNASERIVVPEPGTAIEIDQIVERFGWTPQERLNYLLDMLVFEERAHRARLVDRSR
jgi:hypothetical protein